MVITRTDRRDRRDSIELAVMEVSNASVGPGSKKWNYDSDKVAKGLHAILSYLKRHVDNDDTTVKQLQVPGLVCGGTSTTSNIRTTDY